MHILQLIAAGIGLATNVPLLWGIYKGTIQQSFAAYFLWALLEGIAAATTIIAHGNFALPVAYAFTSTAVAVSLAIKRQVSWKRTETVTACLVAVCMVIWRYAGPTNAIIASSVAVVFASIPQFVETYTNPKGTPTFIYCMFLLANLLSFIAGKAWTIEERFFSGCGVFLTIIVVAFSLRGQPRKEIIADFESNNRKFVNVDK